MSAIEMLLDILFPPRDTQLVLRAQDIRLHPTPIHIEPHTMALLSYREPLTHAAIIETKFHGSTRGAKLLGETLDTYLKEQSLEGVLVPIPLSNKRLQERGYNQVERICRATDHPVQTDILKRIRHTAPQTSRSGTERRTAMQGAFQAEVVDPLATYILVDDVTTTGATLIAAVQALQDAGAQRIIPIALAH